MPMTKNSAYRRPSAPDEEQGQEQRQRQTEIDVLDIGHLSPTSRSVSGSSAAMDSVSVRSTA